MFQKVNSSTEQATEEQDPFEISPWALPFWGLIIAVIIKRVFFE